MYTSTAEQQRRTAVQSLADQLYRERHHYLLRIATRNAANQADAEEALQDAFISFIDHFQPAGEAPALAWLTLTLQRRCWALYRRRHLDRSAGQEAAAGADVPGSHVASIPSRASGPEQLLAQVDEARARLATLKPAERRALGLIAAGYSYIEVGEITGWTYTKVNRCLSEGRTALRASMAGEL
jgi:RNA polymerase sigma factor (sigma-70 family)